MMTPIRSFGARATGLRLCRRIVAGSLKLKDVADSQKAELLILLDQSADMLDRLKPVAKEVGQILSDREKAA